METARLSRGDRTYKPGALMVVLVAGCLWGAAACLWSGVANAQTAEKVYTRADYTDWLNKYANAKPDFKVGDVLTAKDIERMRPFVIPGYLDYLKFPDFRMRIVAPIDHTPIGKFQDCTEKYQPQVRLKPDGTMANYRCGQPFNNAELKVGDPASGIKAGWNWNQKWMSYGLAQSNVIWIWVRFDGSPSHTPPTMIPPGNFMLLAPPEGWTLPTDFSSYYRGGGTFQRTLQSNYEHLVLSNLANLDGGNLPGANGVEWKEITGFYSPFDIRGTEFIIYRYTDPFRNDDAWAYVPTLRRVRRVSVETKYDSLLGTDHTLDDFYGYAGRTLETDWKFLGWKDVLCVCDPAKMYDHLYGPNGIIPDEDWELRRQIVLERIPKNPRHPYSSAIMFIDPQIWFDSFHVAFDHSGKLWKIFQWQWKWTETIPPPWDRYNKGVNTVTWQAVNDIDVQNKRGTIINAFGDGFPDVSSDLPKYQKRFDINSLEEVHR